MGYTNETFKTFIDAYGLEILLSSYLTAELLKVNFKIWRAIFYPMFDGGLWIISTTEPIYKIMN